MERFAILLLLSGCLAAQDAAPEPVHPGAAPADPSAEPAMPDPALPDLPAVPDPMAGDPGTAGDPGAAGTVAANDPPPDQVAERRERHQGLIDAHPTFAVGAIDERWQKTLLAAEDAQKAVPTQEDLPSMATIEAQGVLESRLLDLDQLLDRMELDGEMLDVSRKLDGHEELAQRGGKAKQLAGLRERLVSSLEAMHALQREALAIRLKASVIEAQAEAKEAEAEAAGTTLGEARDALSELGERIDDAISPGLAEPKPEAEPDQRHF